MLVYLLAFVCASPVSCQVYAPESWDGPEAMEACRERAAELAGTMPGVEFTCELDADE